MIISVHTNTSRAEAFNDWHKTSYSATIAFFAKKVKFLCRDEYA